MKLILTLLWIVSEVLAGKKTACLVAANGIIAGLAVGCTIMTVGVQTIPCAVGGSSMTALATSACNGNVTKRSVVIENLPTEKNKYSYCTDFGSEYGFECIKPRHLKKLGDFVLKTDCKIPTFNQTSQCLGEKFAASCNQGKLQTQMCKVGFTCSQSQKNATCAPI
jgi:hypothetical protein